MRIAPWRQGRLAAEIFDPDVMSADKRALTVHRDDLAVIAEVQLQAVHEAAIGGERVRLHAGRAQRRHVAVGQIETADAVVQEIDAHALLRFRDQRVFKHLAERVVTHDKELHDHVIACAFDRFEDRLESRGAVHQRAHGIARQERHAAEARERMHESRAKFLGRQPGRRGQRVPCLRMGARAQQFVFDAASVRVTLRICCGRGTGTAPASDTAWRPATRPMRSRLAMCGCSESRGTPQPRREYGRGRPACRCEAGRIP